MGNVKSIQLTASAASKRLRGLLIAFALVAPFTSCTHYKYGDQSYYSSAQALAQQRAVLEQSLEAIGRTERPVQGSALVALPSPEEIRRHYVRTTGNTGAIKKEHIEYLCATVENEQDMLAKGIEKMHLFDQVEVVHSENPAATPIAGHDYLIIRDIDGWFINSQKASPRKITPVASAASASARAKSFFEVLEATAHSLVK